MTNHQCTTLVLHCIDFRLQKALLDWGTKNNILGDCDVVSTAGAVKNILAPESDVMRNIAIAEKLHGITKVILINHTDCGAYGGAKAFASKKEEVEKHLADLTAAESHIKKDFPKLSVRKFIADIQKDCDIDIREY